MKGTFDRRLAEAYEKDFMVGSWTANFLQAFRPAVSLFVAAEDLAYMEQRVVQEGRDPEIEVCRRVLAGSRVGATIFADCGKRLDYVIFQCTMKERMEQLEHLDFEVAEVANFRRLMHADIEALHSGGHSYGGEEA